MFKLNLSVLCLLHLFVIFASICHSVQARKIKTSAPSFSKHSTVKFQLNHSRSKREITSTRDTSGTHHEDITLKVPVDGEEYILDLHLNKDLLTDNHVLKYQENGKTVLYKPKKEEIDMCHYGGTIRGKPGSWVAVSTCHGVQGSMFDGYKLRHIEPVQGDVASQHYLYDQADVIRTDANHKHVTSSPVHSRHPNVKAQQKIRASSKVKPSGATQMKGPYNENELTRYLELALVVDKSLFLANDADLRTVHRKIKTIVNIVNSLYAPLNISVALVGLEVWNQGDKIAMHGWRSVHAILADFKNYRKNHMLKAMPNDYAQLFTNKNIGVAGISCQGWMCSTTDSGGVIANHSAVIGELAATMAHEMGHTLGIDHDMTSCKCPDKLCIMYPSEDAYTPKHWSACSFYSRKLESSKGLDLCLRNKPKSLFGSPTCGNGYVEVGEQCDCGTVTDPRAVNLCHQCCDPKTCMLRSNATCGTGQCCDLQTCRPKTAGTMCRSAKRDCDLPEYCTGMSEDCPNDVYKMDTTPCGVRDKKAYCMQGECRSHTYQCKRLWGNMAKNSNDDAYTKKDSVWYNDCGFDLLEEETIECESTNDLKCGRLKCECEGECDEQMNNMYGNDSSSSTNVAIFDLGLNVVDPGLVPDGAICGPGKMCMNQRCMSVAKLQQKIAKTSSVCPSNCSGHGVCNSEGHCHCDPGFAPPTCALPAPGGSVDSGPASNLPNRLA